VPSDVRARWRAAAAWQAQRARTVAAADPGGEYVLEAALCGAEPLVTAGGSSS